MIKYCVSLFYNYIKSTNKLIKMWNLILKYVYGLKETTYENVQNVSRIEPLNSVRFQLKMCLNP